MSATPLVGIVAGARSDLPVLERASKQLEELGVPHAVDVRAVDRDPAGVVAWAAGARDAGYEVLVAGSRAAHLPALLAAATPLPVIGVPCRSEHLGGADALYAVVQAPRGVPVATVGIDDAENAAILAARILALSHDDVRVALDRFRAERSGEETEHREVLVDGGDTGGGFGFQPQR